MGCLNICLLHYCTYLAKKVGLDLDFCSSRPNSLWKPIKRWKFDVIGSTCIGYWLRNLGRQVIGQVRQNILALSKGRYSLSSLQFSSRANSLSISDLQAKLFLWPTTFNGAVPKTHCRLLPSIPSRVVLYLECLDSGSNAKELNQVIQQQKHWNFKYLSTSSSCLNSFLLLCR